MPEEDPRILELRASPLFRHLPAAALAGIAPEVSRRVYTRGQRIFQQGEPAVGFYVILFGRVKIQVSSGSGKEQVLHFFAAGDSFGEAAMLAGGDFHAEALAMERTRVAYVPAAVFHRELAERPEFARLVMVSMARRLLEFSHIIEDLSMREVKARLACYLLREGGAQRGLTLPVGKGELAQLLGTTAESLSRSLRALSDQGAIAVDGKRITLLDPDALLDLAGN
jgi:CRP-like cAMP-binding protein